MDDIARVVRILKLPEVKSQTGLSRSQIYKLIKTGQFPAQVPLTDTAVGWVEGEVQNWLEKRLSLRPQSRAA